MQQDWDRSCDVQLWESHWMQKFIYVIPVPSDDPAFNHSHSTECLSK